MKTTQRSVLTRNSANQIAAQLRKSYPRNPFEKRDQALEIANRLAYVLTNMNHADVSREIFPLNETQKNARVWTQVANLLKKK